MIDPKGYSVLLLLFFLNEFLEALYLYPSMWVIKEEMNEHRRSYRREWYCHLRGRPLPDFFSSSLEWKSLRGQTVQIHLDRALVCFFCNNRQSPSGSIRPWSRCHGNSFAHFPQKSEQSHYRTAWIVGGENAKLQAAVLFKHRLNQRISSKGGCQLESLK